MQSGNERPSRRSLRLASFDYSRDGAYFVTICVQDRECLLGEVVHVEDFEPPVVRLTPSGAMVQTAWNQLPERFSCIELDAFQVMPNHFHAILFIHHDSVFEDETVRAGTSPAPTRPRMVPPGPTADLPPVGAPFMGAPEPRPSLGEVIGAVKSITTGAYIDGVRNGGWPPFRARFWQRTYFEHIIHSERSLQAIRQYIVDNPGRWLDDPENPAVAERQPVGVPE
jgi:putative transposase